MNLEFEKQEKVEENKTNGWNPNQHDFSFELFNNSFNNHNELHDNTSNYHIVCIREDDDEQDDELNDELNDELINELKDEHHDEYNNEHNDEHNDEHDDEHNDENNDEHNNEHNDVHNDENEDDENDEDDEEQEAEDEDEDDDLFQDTQAMMFIDIFNTQPQQCEDEKEKIIRNLPFFEYQKFANAKEYNENCVICREEFIEKEFLMYLPCFHLYHKDCILIWLGKNDICPFCKNSIIN